MPNPDPFLDPILDDELVDTVPDPKETHQVMHTPFDPAQALPKSAEHSKVYDIYLSMACQMTPDLGELLQEVPELADPAFIARIRQWTPGGPGFLGLNLSRTTAKAVVKRLKKANACGYRIAAAYREPKITAAEAKPIAEKAMAELQRRERYHGLTFNPLMLEFRHPAYWVFCAPCPEWFEEDRVPSALHVCVDRLDGHVWQEKEFADLHDERPMIPLRPVYPTTQPDPVAV